jgi:endonuclease/exonuclease/phosphatase family metal-dependent hydrolase
MNEHQIRVMSFNVRGSFHDVGKKNAWRNRADLNVATIERYAPDVIGLQEAQRGNLDAYHKRLPRYSHIRGPRYGNTFPHDFNTILFDPERLEPLDSAGFWLSETPEKHSRSWETSVARSATWTLFRVLDSGFTFLHLNTHLDHVSAPARREGSKLIVKRIAGISERTGTSLPVIVTGDFNSRPGNRTHRNFTESGFVDTYLAAGNEDGANTFHAFQGTDFRDTDPDREPLRIDWIFLKDPEGRLRIRSQRIIRDADESQGLYPSDHYPIMVELEY